MEKLYYVEDVCTLLRCTRKTLKRLVKDGKLKPPLELRANLQVWTQTDIDEYIANAPRSTKFATSEDKETTEEGIDHENN